MSASQILLAGHGHEDQWLSDNPNRTYFEAKYNPHVNRSRETFEIPFDNQDATFGSTGRCTIPVKGDYMTRMTLRTVMPPIYPTVPGQYVYPTPSSEVGATVYVNKALDLVVADGVTLTANTVGNHYFSIGAQVILAGTAYVIFDLDGTYTITGIPTANSFTCSTVLAGISYNGTVSSPGIQCGDIISYFSTTNSNLWVNNVTNKTWGVTNAYFSGAGTQLVVNTSASSGFSVGQSVNTLITSLGVNNRYTVVSSTDTTFTVNYSSSSTFVAGGNFKSTSSTTFGQTWDPTVSVSGFIAGIAYGNGTVVGVSRFYFSYSTNGGQSWTSLSAPANQWYGVAFGNSTFVAVGYTNSIAYSTNNGQTWTYPTVTTPTCFAVAFGNNTFVAVGVQPIYSTNNGQTWTVVASLGVSLYGVAFGNNTFVAVSPSGSKAWYSTNNGQTWTPTGTSVSGFYSAVTYDGIGTFVAVATNSFAMYSTNNGQTWTEVSTPAGIWRAVAFGNGVFIAVGDNNNSMRSTNNGQTWSQVTTPTGMWTSIVYASPVFSTNQPNLVYANTPPLQLTNRVFSSSIYPSISFQNAADAAFWGFDARNGLTYSLPVTPPWTLTQSGWISGFLPPSTSTYDDSVAHKLCKAVRVLVGKQTIKEYSGEYIELQNDLLVPYENKAILKLMNGTLDQTQATVAREYYVNLPLGTKEVPLCALTHQNMSIEVDFDSYLNVSQNLNQGTGDFLDAKSYTTYDASTGLLNGQPVNVQTTFSYQQYIFIVTYGGQFIIFDTTKNVDDPASYIVLSAFSGSNLFKQFCVLSGNLYIGLTDGQLVRGLIDELIQGNISSLELNSYTPTIGSLTGTIVADFRYVYYAVSNTATSNVFFSRYDTTNSFTNSSSYLNFNFTSNVSSSTSTVYQFISNGSQLIALTDTPGYFYNFNLFGDFVLSWSRVDYSTLGQHITSGVLIGTTLYFICDGFSIVSYVNGVFKKYNLVNYIFFSPYYVGAPYSFYSINNGQTWSSVYTPPGLGFWKSAFGNNTLVLINSNDGMYSLDNGQTWTSMYIPAATWRSITFGNNAFVAVGTNASMYSLDNGKTWALGTTPSGTWGPVSFGNGVFVAVDYLGSGTMYSLTNGQTWTPVATSFDNWTCLSFGNNTFVAIGQNSAIYSTTKGQTWSTPVTVSSNSWNAVAFGNGTFVAVNNYPSPGGVMYSTTNGASWIYPASPAGSWYDVTFGNGTFVAVGLTGETMYSSDNGQTWTKVLTGGFLYQVKFGINTNLINLPVNNGLQNLTVVNSKIYASSNSSTVSSVIEIDTTVDLNSPSAYKYYSSTDSTAPITFGGSAPMIFANGPRYVYMFAQGDNTATNIVEFDPYGPDTTFKASIIVDYESLPPDTKKPDKALLGIVQTQKVTDMTQMNIKGPVKELWMTGVSATTNVFQYSNLATQSTLELAGEQIVTDDVGTRTFLNTIEPFETHTSMPIRNFSVIPFEFDPESSVPNGTVNFSRIRDQIFDGDAETVWARTYNLLAIQGGIGNLMYN